MATSKYTGKVLVIFCLHFIILLALPYQGKDIVFTFIIEYIK
jgi:hypothetical protein